MFTKTKQILLKRSISARRRVLQSSNKQIHSFDTAQTVGILFLLKQGSLPAEVRNFMQYLKQNKLSHFALGYYDKDRNPDNFIAPTNVAVFNSSDKNWYNKPTSNSVEEFLHKKYDIVIDLCRDDDVTPLQYVAACVNAATLIGGHNYDDCPYDLIIDAQKTCNTTDYIEQVKHYLKIITPPPKKITNVQK
jgi:hypothetical protein